MEKGFQSLFFWKWCLRTCTPWQPYATQGVSILVFLEVVFKAAVNLMPYYYLFEFQSLFFWKWCLRKVMQAIGSAPTSFQSLFFWKWCLRTQQLQHRMLLICVSILVFLEVVFKVGDFLLISQSYPCFNPCFSGSGV